MPTGFTPIIASNIQSASGTPLKNGLVAFTPVSTLNGRAVSAIAGGAGGPIVGPAVFKVTNGVIVGTVDGGTAQVADTALTNPANIAYCVTITDESTGDEVQGPGYGMVQPTGPGPWSLDTYVPNQPLQATVQVGPQGPPGPSGVATGALYSEDLTSQIDGVTATFTLTRAPLFTWPFLDGVRQRGWSVSGTTLTLATAPQIGDTLVVDYLH